MNTKGIAPRAPPGTKGMQQSINKSPLIPRPSLTLAPVQTKSHERILTLGLTEKKYEKNTDMEKRNIQITKNIYEIKKKKNKRTQPPMKNE